MADKFKIVGAPPSARMDNFYSVVGGGGELSPVDRSIVRINAFTAMNAIDGMNPIMPDLLYLCDTGELPGRTLSTIEARYYGPMFKVPNMTQYNDITLTFLIRLEFEERLFFDHWMNIINPPNTYDFAYRNDYMTTIDIFQYDEIGTPQYCFKLREAYPVSIAPMQTTWADDQFHRLSVQFVYTYWDLPDDPLWPKKLAFELVPSGSRLDGGTQSQTQLSVSSLENTTTIAKGKAPINQ